MENKTVIPVLGYYPDRPNKTVNPPPTVNPPGDYLRDDLAMAALQASPDWQKDSNSTYVIVARRCYQMADAMLWARKQENW